MVFKIKIKGLFLIKNESLGVLVLLVNLVVKEVWVL